MYNLSLPEYFVAKVVCDLSKRPNKYICVLEKIEDIRGYTANQIAGECQCDPKVIVPILQKLVQKDIILAKKFKKYTLYFPKLGEKLYNLMVDKEGLVGIFPEKGGGENGNKSQNMEGQ